MKRYLVDPLSPELRKPFLSFLPAFEPDDDGGGDDGGEENDDSQDDGDGEENDDESQDDDDKDKNKDDDKGDVEAELKKLRRASRRAAAEAKKWREIAQGKRKADDDGEGEEGKSKGPDFRQAALVSTGVTALTAAGYSGTPSRAQRLIALADLRGIEPDDSGLFSTEDFADVVDEIRDEFPELFRSEDDDDAGRRRNGSGPRNASRRSSGTNGSGGGGRQLSANEKFAASIMGAAGYDGAVARIKRGR